MESLIKANFGRSILTVTKTCCRVICDALMTLQVMADLTVAYKVIFHKIISLKGSINSNEKFVLSKLNRI